MAENIRMVFDVTLEVLNELRIDVQEVVGFVFDQFGIHDVWTRVENATNQARSFCFSSCPQTGRKRSVVRLIGSRLPFKPTRRPFFRLVRDSAGIVKPKWYECPQEPRVFPLSDDVAYVYKSAEQEDTYTNFDGLNRFGSMINEADFNAFETVTSTPKKKGSSLDSMTTMHLSYVNDSQKIFTMQEEIDRLRMLVTGFIDQASKANRNTSPSRCLVRVAAPPPPPPPMPEIPIFILGSNAAIQNTKKNNMRNLTPSSRGLHPSTSNSVNMADVLKDMGSVKLKHVARSPGGTPLRFKPRTEDNDPASIMTAALRKRFAHMETLQESFNDKDHFENDSIWDCDSNGSSPRVKAC